MDDAKAKLTADLQRVALELAARRLEIAASMVARPPPRRRPLWPCLAVAVAFGIAIGWTGVMFWDRIDWAELVAGYWLPLIVVGAAGGLANYLYRVTEGQPFSAMLAFLHTVLGAFFGPMTGAAVGGMGGSPHVEVAAAGFGGGMGPKAATALLPSDLQPDKSR